MNEEKENIEEKENDTNAEHEGDIGTDDTNIEHEEEIYTSDTQDSADTSETADITEITEIQNPDTGDLPYDNTAEADKRRTKLKTIIISSVCLLLLIAAIVCRVLVKQHIDNVNAANEVVNMINDIGEVFATDESNEKITAACVAFNSLTDKQKSYVTNIDVLASAQRDYESKKADLDLTLLASELKTNSELCQAFFSDYSGVWYNAIYRKKDKYNNGDFSDFNNALQAFQASDTYTSAQTTLNTINKSIVNKLSELKNSPPSDTEAYEAVKNLYAAYQQMYELASHPEGSYNSYTSEVQRLNGNYKSAYANLTIAMPTLGLADGQ